MTHHRYEYEDNSVKSYANMKTLERAVSQMRPDQRLRYLVYTRKDGRLVPVFVGSEAVRAGVHFHHPVIA